MYLYKGQIILIPSGSELEIVSTGKDVKTKKDLFGVVVGETKIRFLVVDLFQGIGRVEVDPENVRRLYAKGQRGISEPSIFFGPVAQHVFILPSSENEEKICNEQEFSSMLKVIKEGFNKNDFFIKEQ